jgi:hypothetical protein
MAQYRARPPIDHELRAGHRNKLFEAATIKSIDGEASAHVLDISCSGAMMAMRYPPPVSARVIVHCRSIQCVASVAWVSGRRFGVQFQRPMDEMRLSAFIASLRQTLPGSPSALRSASRVYG